MSDPSRALLDALPAAILAFDAQARLTFVNARTFAFSGIDETVITIGASLAEIAHILAFRGFYGPGDPDAQVAVALALDRSKVHRRVVQTVPGRWFEVGSVPLPDGGFVTYSREVTPEKQNESEARERAMRLEGVLAGLNGGIALYDADHRLVLHNPAFEALTGATAAMLADHPTLPELVERLRGADEVSGHAEAEALAGILCGEQRGVREVQHRRADGRVVRYTRVPMPDGGFIVEATDVSALKRGEDEARTRAAMLQAALAALPHGVSVFGPDRRLVVANPAHDLIMDGAPSTPGESLSDIVHRRAAAGEYGPGDPAEIARIQLGFSLKRTRVTQRLRPNGTAIDERTAPLPDGGHVSVVTDITPIYRAEEEARRRSVILETMLETMRHGIIMFGPDRRLIAANALAERMAEHEPGRLQPGSLYDDLMRELHERGVLGEGEEADALLRTLLEADRTEPSRYTRRGLDGRMLEIASDPTPDGGFVITQVDITALAYAEEEAQRRADLLQSMLDNMRYGIVLFGPDRRLIAINALASRLSGLPISSYRIGRTIEEVMADAVRAGVFEADHAERVIRTDRSVPNVYRRALRDGMVLDISSDPVADGGFIVVLSDVTKLAEAEAEAARRAQLLQSMLDNIRHGVCLFDEDGRVLAANVLAAHMTGLTPAEMAPGATLAQLRIIQAERGEYGTVEDADRVARDRLDRGWVLPQRYVRRRGNGGMLEVTTDAIPGGGFIRTYSDVTADYAIRAELEAARSAAEAGSQAKSRFLATMSHELRTPLNAIIGFSELLGRDDVPAAEVREFAASIRDSGEQLRSLIDDILDVARAESQRLDVTVAEVAPGTVASAAVEAMRDTITQAGLTLDVAIAADLPGVLADAARLRRILLSLLSNAAKFTPAGGRVALRVTAGDGNVLFIVEDSGIGMPDADVARAFEPFTQLDDRPARRHEGSGIGLHLSRVLAEAQGGQLILESQPGQGTVARLTLPAMRPRTRATDKQNQGATA